MPYYATVTHRSVIATFHHRSRNIEIRPTIMANLFIPIEIALPILAPGILLVRHPDDLLIVVAHPLQAAHMLLVS